VHYHNQEFPLLNNAQGSLGKLEKTFFVHYSWHSTITQSAIPSPIIFLEEMSQEMRLICYKLLGEKQKSDGLLFDLCSALQQIYIL
jgi:hypothetical protein